MSATPKMDRQLGHVHVVGGGTGNQANSLAGGNQQDQSIGCEKLAHFMRYGRNFVIEVVGNRLCDQNAVTFNIQLDQVLQKAVIELLLRVG